MAASRLRCRPTTGSTPSGARRDASPSATRSSGRSCAIAAASSIPRGSPSTARQMDTTSRAPSAPPSTSAPAAPSAVEEQGCGGVPTKVSPTRRFVGCGHGERRHAPHRLAGHAQPGPAGGQHPQRRAERHHRADQRGRRLDHVLAVVEHQEGRSIGEGPTECRDRIAALGETEGSHDRQRDVAGRERNELDEPGRRSGPIDVRPRGLDGEAGLAHAAGPDEGDEPGVGEELHELGERAVAPEEAGERGRDDTCRRFRSGPVGGRRAGDEGALQGGQIGRRFEARLFDEERAELLEGADRIHGAPGRLQGAHPPFPHGLAEGVGVGETDRVGHRLGGAAERQQGVETRQFGRGAQLLEADRFHSSELLIGELGVRPAPPELEGVVQRGERLRRRLVPSPIDQHLEVPRIDVTGRQRQRVPGRAERDGVAAEVGAQAGDVGLQGVEGVRRRGAVPHHVDEPIVRHDVAAGHRQRRQEPALAP